MHLGAGGYVGLTRCGEGEVHVAAALSVKATRAAGGPVGKMMEILRETGVDVSRMKVLGTPLLSRRREVAGNRVLAIGDACGYVEPFTGEGIAWALRGAVGAAELLCAAGGDGAGVAAETCGTCANGLVPGTAGGDSASSRGGGGTCGVTNFADWSACYRAFGGTYCRTQLDFKQGVRMTLIDVVAGELREKTVVAGIMGIGTARRAGCRRTRRLNWRRKRRGRMSGRNCGCGGCLKSAGRGGAGAC